MTKSDRPTNPDPGPPPGTKDPGPPAGARDSGPPAGAKDAGPPPGMRDSGPPPGAKDAGPPAGMKDPGPPGGGDSGPPGGVDAPPKIDAATIRFFWPLVAEQRGRLTSILLLLLVGASLPVAMSFLPTLLGRYWHPGTAHIVVGILVAFLVLSVFAILLSTVQAYLTASMAQELSTKLKATIFRKVGSLSKSAMAFRSVGSLAHRSSGDVAHLQEFMARFVPEAVANVISLVLAIGAMLFLQPIIAIVGLITMPILWFLMERVNGRVRGLARSSQQQSESALTRLIEGISGYIDLVAAGRFPRAADEYAGVLDSLRRTAIKMTITSSLAALIPSFSFLAITFGFYFVAVRDPAMLLGPEQLGQVMTFASLINFVRGPIMILARFFTEAAVAAPSFHEVKRLLEAPEVVAPTHGARIEGSEIEFRDVSFQYDPKLPPVLDRVAFKVPPGSFTAIVGETGSGKTTLFHLLLRLLEPNAGEIRIGGAPLAGVALEELRSYVGFIPQSPFLFDSTIRENVAIALREHETDDKKLLHACELAQLNPVIEKRKAQGGLDARVGAAGASLSGGERQRVALARVFLRDPQVIVCDEYTANIDNATARLIQQAIAREFHGRTRIVITHQLYTIRGADQILVLDRGRIADRGTHEELSQRPGLYREMWEVQRLG